MVRLYLLNQASIIDGYTLIYLCKMIPYYHKKSTVDFWSTVLKEFIRGNYSLPVTGPLIGLKVTLTVTCCGFSIQQLLNFNVTGIVNGLVSSSC